MGDTYECTIESDEGWVETESDDELDYLITSTWPDWEKQFPNGVGLTTEEHFQLFKSKFFEFYSPDEYNYMGWKVSYKQKYQTSEVSLELIDKALKDFYDEATECDWKFPNVR